jgi:hypothetical protein
METSEAVRRLEAYVAQMERRYECDSATMERRLEDGVVVETLEISKWMADSYILSQLRQVVGRAAG